MFTPNMTLPTLNVDFDTDAECRTALEELRWPDGVRCLRCQSDKISRIHTRKQFDCDSCRYRFSVTTGTIFHDSHLALPKWFIAIYLICESKHGISANQLKRCLGVSYKTAWYLCHRVRGAMRVDNAPLKGEYMRGEVRTNRVEGMFSLFKRSLTGSFHQVSHKHLDRYLDEFAFKLDNRKNPYRFRDTITRLVQARSLPYDKLTASPYRASSAES